MPRIFITYRRDDTEAVAGRLYDTLRLRFGRDRIFRDIDTLRGGQDYAATIDHVIRTSDVVLVLIGNRWLSAVDEHGRRRLDDPEDLVVREIATALASAKVIIPVRVQDAPMPSRSELPEALAALAARNAVELSDSRWEYDVSRIVAEFSQPWWQHPMRRAIVATAGVVGLVAAATYLAASGVFFPPRLSPEPATAVPPTVSAAASQPAIDPTVQAEFASSTPGSRRIYDSSAPLPPDHPDPKQRNQQAAMTLAWMLRTVGYRVTWQQLGDMLGDGFLSRDLGVLDPPGLEGIATALHDRFHLPAASSSDITFEWLSGRVGRQPIVVCGQIVRQCVGVRAGEATSVQLVNPEPELGLRTILRLDDFDKERFDAIWLDVLAPQATQNAPVAATPTLPPKPSPTLAPTPRPTPSQAAPHPTKPYDPSTPTVLQRLSWNDSAAATAWLLQSIGIDWSQDDVVNALGPSKINSSVGLTDGSGAALAALLNQLTGLKTHNAATVSFDEAVTLARSGPLVLGARGMFHWMGVRGASDDGATLLLANPAPNYDNVGEKFSRDDFQRWGPCSAVWIELS